MHARILFLFALFTLGAPTFAQDEAKPSAEEAIKVLVEKISARDAEIKKLQEELTAAKAEINEKNGEIVALRTEIETRTELVKKLETELAAAEKLAAKPMMIVKLPADWRGDHLVPEISEEAGKIVVRVSTDYREHLSTRLVVTFVTAGGTKKVLERPIVVPAATYDGDTVKNLGFDEQRVAGAFADLKAVIIDLRDSDNTANTRNDTTNADELVVEVKPGNEAWNKLSESKKQRAHQPDWTYTRDQAKACGWYVEVDGERVKLRRVIVDGEKRYAPR